MCQNNKPSDGEIKKARLALEGMKHAFLSFDRRRSYEWKLNIAIWTAIAAFMGLAFRGEIRAQEISSTRDSWLGMIAIGIAVVHFVFLLCAREANDIEKKKACAYEEMVAKAAGVTLPKLQKRSWVLMGLRRYWAPLCQTAITILLLAAAGLIVSRQPKGDETGNADASHNATSTSRPVQVNK